MKTERSRTAAGYLCAAGTVLIWSGFIIVSRVAGKGTLTAFDVAALRFLVGGTLLAPLILWRGPGELPMRRLVPLVATAGVGFATLVYSAFRLAPAAHGSILLPGTLPFLTAMATLVIIGEKPDRRRQLSLALIALGIACLALQIITAPAAVTPRGPIWVGDLLFLCASGCWAVFTVLLRKWQVPPWDAVVGVTVGAMIVYLPVYILFLPKAIDVAPWSEILLQGIYQGVFAAFVAFVFYTQAVRWIGASQAATIMAVVPGLSALLAVPLLNEPLTVTVAIGLVLVTAGAFIGARTV